MPISNNNKSETINRDALGASLKAILLSTTKWSKLAEENEFTSGYWEGIIDTLEQISVMYQLELKLPELSIKWEANPEWAEKKESSMQSQLTISKGK